MRAHELVKGLLEKLQSEHDGLAEQEDARHGIHKSMAERHESFMGKSRQDDGSQEFHKGSAADHRAAMDCCKAAADHHRAIAGHCAAGLDECSKVLKAIEAEELRKATELEPAAISRVTPDVPDIRPVPRFGSRGVAGFGGDALTDQVLGKADERDGSAATWQPPR